MNTIRAACGHLVPAVGDPSKDHADTCDNPACVESFRRARIHERVVSFATDDEQHEYERAEWESMRGKGISLYVNEDFFVAYYDDADIVKRECEDELPMVWRKTLNGRQLAVIHETHIAAWLQHFAEIHLPVEIASVECLESCGPLEDES